jgi:hypothetical protein
MDLLPAFFAIAAVVVAGAGAFVGAVIKSIVINFVMPATGRPRLVKVAGVAAWETLAISLAFLLAVTFLEPRLIPGSQEKGLFIAALFGYVIAISFLLILFPNCSLLRSRRSGNCADEALPCRMWMAAVLSLIAPLVTAAIALGLGLSFAG